MQVCQWKVCGSSGEQKRTGIIFLFSVSVCFRYTVTLVLSQFFVHVYWLSLTLDSVSHVILRHACSAVNRPEVCSTPSLSHPSAWLSSYFFHISFSALSLSLLLFLLNVVWHGRVQHICSECIFVEEFDPVVAPHIYIYIYKHICLHWTLCHVLDKKICNPYFPCSNLFWYFL